MKKSTKFIAVLLFALAIISMLGMTASAASDSDTWQLRYIPSAPSSEQTLVDYCPINVYGPGYKAKSTYIDGTGSKSVAIVTSNGNGTMSKSVEISRTGVWVTFNVSGYTGSYINFKIQVSHNSDGSAMNNGNISINN